LLRDNSGLGFSIAGGLGAAPFKEGSESLYVSKITDGGTAHRDGKLRVGDKIVQINGVDVSDARHDQVFHSWTSSIKLENYKAKIGVRFKTVPIIMSMVV
jgi:C-terminal processing protease CtpA/Prc